MANPLKDERIGQRLGDYRIERVLATGGMARIYVGKDDKLDREAAVKVLTQEMVESDSVLAQRFEREARAVARLDHPNIIPIYQYGQQDEVFFLAMKLVRGRDLADEIKAIQKAGAFLPVQRMLAILRQIADALDHAHSHGIIHRDVKPSNVLIEESTDRAILTDFGLVLQQTEIDKTMGTAFGTPRYISPEQALASESVVPQSDVYSLAVIVYEIVTGQQVFKADTAMQIALSHISDPPPPPTTIKADIPKAVEYEILKALSKDPDARHERASQFIEALAEAYGMAKSPVASSAHRPDTQPLDDLPAGSRKKSSLPLLALVGVVLAVLVAAVALMTGGDDPAGLVPSGAGIVPIVAPVELGAAQSAQIRYNREALALYNPADVALSVHQLQITRGGVLGFDGTAQVNAQRLLPGECVVVQTAESRVALPSEWECGRVRNLILRYGDGLFWRGEDGDFRVNLPDGATVDCPLTDADGDGVTCDITLPAIDGDAA
ncbi:MAG: serine/threonine protein kinase [Anaerolineaceae bacterium]|nr:MAG: serine/threonine protein kinase [Anaerolineaceae bacterium]